MPLNPIIGKFYDVLTHIATQTKLPANSSGIQDPLASESELVAIKALAGYAKRDGFSGAIATLLHRIWNAAKAIFGQSDWQRAEKAVVSMGQRIVPHADQLFCMGKNEIYLMQLYMSTPQFKEKISENFEEVISRLNTVNKELKGIEEKIVPLVERILVSYDITKIASEILNTKCHYSLSELQEINEQLQAKLPQNSALNFLSFGEKLHENGCLTQQGLDNLKELLASDEMPQLMKSIPELMTLVLGIGLYFQPKCESALPSFSSSTVSTDSESLLPEIDDTLTSAAEKKPKFLDNVRNLPPQNTQCLDQNMTIEELPIIELKETSIEEIICSKVKEERAVTKTEGEVKAKAETKEKAQAQEAEKVAKAEAEVKAKAEAKEKAQAEEAEKVAKAEAEVKAKAEAKEKAQAQEAEKVAKAQAEVKAKAEAKEKAQAEEAEKVAKIEINTNVFNFEPIAKSPQSKKAKNRELAKLLRSEDDLDFEKVVKKYSQINLQSKPEQNINSESIGQNQTNKTPPEMKPLNLIQKDASLLRGGRGPKAALNGIRSPSALLIVGQNPRPSNRVLVPSEVTEDNSHSQNNLTIKENANILDNKSSSSDERQKEILDEIQKRRKNIEGGDPKSEEDTWEDFDNQ